MSSHNALESWELLGMEDSDSTKGFVDTRRHSTISSRPSPSRRETIMSLVELLLKKNDDESAGHGQTTTTAAVAAATAADDEKAIPTVDERLQAAGADAFRKFQKRINNLDIELRNFANSARQLGSSVAILSSTFHLRERLAQLLYLFHANAASLYPRMIPRAENATNLDLSFHETRRKHWKRLKYKGPPHVARPIINEKLNLEQFPHYFDALAIDVVTFLNCLNEFPEFTDEAVNVSIMSFEADLKYWSSCLREYKGQFRNLAVQRYIHDLSSEMGEHIDNITESLSMFIEVGVPTIRFGQKHAAMNLLNLSTIATFLSAVTATCLQYSFASLGSKIANAVNGFWFASLVFSIAAAVNSLLGLTWKQAMYRSPGHRVPWWVLIWIKRSPLVFLVISNACFSIGLCCFTYSSSQHYITSTITTVFTAFTSFGLVAVSAWFASERWAFERHEGTKWLGDILVETKSNFLHTAPFRQITSGVKVVKRLCTRLGGHIRSVGHKAGDLLPMYSERKGLAIHISPPCMVEIPATPTESLNPLYRAATATESRKPRPPIQIARNLSMPNLVNPTESEMSEAPRSPKELWEKAFTSVLTRPTLSQAGFAVVSANRERQRGGVEHARQAVSKSRVTELMSELKPFKVTQDLAVHDAIVRHLQFSPDGKYLATSSYDKTTTILRVGEPFEIHRGITHSASQGFAGQVSWSPSGSHLLTKLSRGVKIWCMEDGSCNMIDRGLHVQAVSWFPNGQAFISIEGDSVAKMDLDGNLIGIYRFEHMKLQDVAVSPNCTHLVAVGRLLESPTGLRPRKSRAEKRLAVFNMETSQIEAVAPVLDDVKHVTLASTPRDGLVALVSYESQAPPQLWKVEAGPERVITRLTLRRTYWPATSPKFAGLSNFGGKNNELILCSDKAGVIHTWDQESGVLLHRIQTQPHGGNLTCMGWNTFGESFMLATGSHDGSVKIWTRPNSDGFEESSENTFIPRSASPTPFPEPALSDTASTRRKGSDTFY